MNTYNDLKDGDLVTFNYRGDKDTSPRKRLVRVKNSWGWNTGQPSGFLEVEDVLDNNQFKQFKVSGIASNSIKILGDKNTVVKTGEEAVSGFGKVSRKVQLGGLQEVVKNLVPGAESVIHDEELDTFIVKTKPQNRGRLTFNVDVNNGQLVKATLTWTNQEGKDLNINFTENEVVDAESFLKELTAHYGFGVVKKV